MYDSVRMNYNGNSPTNSRVPRLFSNTSVAYSPVSCSHELLFSSPILLRWSSRSLHVCRPKQLFIIGQSFKQLALYWDKTEGKDPLHNKHQVRQSVSSGKGSYNLHTIYSHYWRHMHNRSIACNTSHELPIMIYHIKQPINATHFICVRLFGVFELTLLFALE